MFSASNCSTPGSSYNIISVTVAVNKGIKIRRTVFDIFYSPGKGDAVARVNLDEKLNRRIKTIELQHFCLPSLRLSGQRFFEDRSWDVGGNPETAEWQFLKKHTEFKIDKSIENKLQVTVAPNDFLKRRR